MYKGIAARKKGRWFSIEKNVAEEIETLLYNSLSICNLILASIHFVHDPDINFVSFL